ncbi:MAG: hypothetical protein K9L17_07795 [Clostridiales bacterium]|nr:hypothetical protein [Clostridiales bacterium]MCF8022575.1 hypothetical protein [Clostridiales bacterium]
MEEQWPCLLQTLQLLKILLRLNVFPLYLGGLRGIMCPINRLYSGMVGRRLYSIPQKRKALTMKRLKVNTPPVYGPRGTAVLLVKNVDPDFIIRLEALSAKLYGDVEIAPWFKVSVSDPMKKVLYRGTLSELANSPQNLKDWSSKKSFLRMEGYSEQKLVFKVTLDRAAASSLQGKTLKADFTVHVGQD